MKAWRRGRGLCTNSWNVCCEHLAFLLIGSLVHKNCEEGMSSEAVGVNAKDKDVSG
jgi:hypothetical protein